MLAIAESPKFVPPPPNSPGSGNASSGTATINSPKLDQQGKPTRAAVDSFQQAHGISKRLYQRGKETRIPTAATIASKYGGDTPFRSADLKRAGQGWRNNFSTNFLASMVDRAKPQMTDPMRKGDTLTRAALPPEVPDADRKTRAFRTRFTRLIRSHCEWVDLLDHIAQEVYLYGHNAPGWLDDHWFPTGFRFDETFLPEGTGQHARHVQHILFRQRMVLQDFVELLQVGEAAATDANYDWQGCLKTADESSDVRGGGDSNALERQDRVREQAGQDSGADASSANIRTVDLFHLLVREYDGTIHLWTTSERGGHGVRHVPNLHQRADDACTLFTLQSGNKKYYGSKGAGRMLTNIHMAVERLRNTTLDKIQVAGLPILKGDAKNIQTFAATVRQPFILIPGDWEMQAEVIQFDYNSYEMADNKLVMIAESIAGAFIPPNIDQGGKAANTKIEAAQKAERELAIKEGVLGRFYGQCMDMVSAMQRKACCPINIREALHVYEQKLQKKQSGIRVLAREVWQWMKEAIGDRPEFKQTEPQETTPIADPAAVDMLVSLLEEGLAIEEIVMLALDSAAGTQQMQGDDADAKTIEFLEARRGNPLYNQKSLEETQAKLALGEDRAKAVLLPEMEDPNLEATAKRTQMLECMLMMEGEYPDVDSRDLHRVHRKVLAEKLGQLEQPVLTAPTPELVTAGNLMCQHYLEHLEKDLETPEEQKQQEGQQIASIQAKFKMVADQMQKLHEEAAKAHGEAAANGMPPPVQGAPIGVGPDGNMVGDPGDRERLAMEDAHHQDEVALKTAHLHNESRKLDQVDRRMDQENKKLDHDMEIDRVGATSEANKVLADVAVSSMAAGQKDAAKDLANHGQ